MLSLETTGEKVLKGEIETYSYCSANDLVHLS